MTTDNIETIKNNIIELQAQYKSVIEAGTELKKSVELYDEIQDLKMDLANAILGPQPEEPTYTVVELSNSWGNAIGFFISDVDDPEQHDDMKIDGEEEEVYEDGSKETYYVSRHWHNVNTAEYVRASGSSTLRYAKMVCRFEPGDYIYEDEMDEDINTEEVDIEF